MPHGRREDLSSGLRAGRTGSSGPNGGDKAPAAKWLALADQFYDASVDKSSGGVGIPMIWGIDAVHGHAQHRRRDPSSRTISGLGAARDPALIQADRRGDLQEGNPRDRPRSGPSRQPSRCRRIIRWGHAYEGYSSDPRLVSSYVRRDGAGVFRGCRRAAIWAGDKVLASTKHFLADGGTEGGADQGDARDQ